MKYIRKSAIPQFFIEDTKSLKESIKRTLISKDKSKVWDNDYLQKRVLKAYLLENEQNYLCGYCEAKISLDNSHVEHIKPKSLDYDNLTFDYSNLLVSCNGICFSESNKPITCGHRKANKFDESKFLNPTQQIDIRDYFIYTNNFYIGSSNLDEEKSKYTMDLLELNSFNNNLPQAREDAFNEFRESVQENAKRTKKDLKDIAKILLNKEDLAFISFLRFKYKGIL